MEVMQRWITQRITSLLGFEDDIVVGTCVNYLSEEVSSMLFLVGHVRVGPPVGLCIAIYKFHTFENTRKER